MKDKWTVIGQVHIDSRTILICDPCRTQHGTNFMEIAIAKLDGNDDPHQVGEGVGVLAPTGLGDGVYNVEALIGEVRDFGEMIKEIRVRFVGPSTMYDV